MILFETFIQINNKTKMYTKILPSELKEGKHFVQYVQLCNMHFN